MEVILRRDHELLIHALRLVATSLRTWLDVGTEDAITRVLMGHERLSTELRRLTESSAP